MNCKSCLIVVASVSFASLVQAAPSTQVLEEIIITAQKREQNIQSTPIAVTALTEDVIRNQQIDGVQKLSQIAPSLVFNNSGAAANTYLRGVGQDISTVLGEPGVAMFVDGVYQGVNHTQVAAYNDLERIEVLRGPQGTLYGRNSTGGNINIFTQKPDFETDFAASVLAGDFNRIKTSVMAQTALVEDKLAIRGNIVTDNRDGYRTNIITGEDVDGEDIASVNLSLLASLSDSIELVIRADWNEQRDDSPAWDYIEEVAGSGLSPQMFGGQAATGARDVRNDRSSNYNTQYQGISADLSWNFDTVNVKSITAYRETKYDADYDGDGTDAAFLNTVVGQFSEQFSQEININGLAFNDKLDWIGGLFYFKQDIDSYFLFDLPVLQGFFESVFPDIQNGFAVPLPAGGLGDPTRNLFYGNRIFTGTGSAVPFLDFRNKQELASYASFAQGTYSLNDALRLTGGVRFSSDEKDNDQTVTANISPDQCQNLQLNEKWDETTWKVGFDWDTGPDTLVYGGVSKGFKSGGFNDGSCGNSYDPETIIAYEAGVKTTLADGRVQINIAAFLYDYEDFQARLFVNNASRVENASGTTIQGLEIESIFVPVNGFNINLAVSIMDSEYEDFSTTNPLTSLVEDVNGNQVLRAPDFSANLGMEYSLPLDGFGDLTLRYEASYKDDYYTTIFVDDFARVDAHTLQNIRITWNSNTHWEIQGFVENLGDVERNEHLAPAATLGGVVGTWAPPRIWGFEVRYSL